MHSLSYTVNNLENGTLMLKFLIRKLMLFIFPQLAYPRKLLKEDALFCYDIEDIRFLTYVRLVPNDLKTTTQRNKTHIIENEGVFYFKEYINPLQINTHIALPLDGEHNNKEIYIKLLKGYMVLGNHFYPKFTEGYISELDLKK